MEKLTRDYAVTKDQLLGRLVRIEGQVRGISRMVHDDRPCVDVLTQISAVHAALDKVALGLLDRHVRLSLVARQSAGGAAGPSTSALANGGWRRSRRSLGRRPPHRHPPHQRGDAAGPPLQCRVAALSS